MTKQYYTKYNIAVDMGGGVDLSFSISGNLLEACVLGILSVKPTYGYDLTQRIQATLDISESTLYPVLRRLQGNALLDTYDAPFDGRNRRYYSITVKGNEILDQYRIDWQQYKQNIENLMVGGVPSEQK